MADLTEEALERMSETSMLFMGLEIGGTNLSAGLVNARAGTVVEDGRRSVKLPDDREPEVLFLACRKCLIS